MGKLVVVAPVGAMVGATEIKAVLVGGIDTNGRLLDEATLGWANAGPAGTVAILHPKQFCVGDSGPLQRPERFRHEATVDAMGNVVVDSGLDAEMGGLSVKKKLTKEEKAEKKKAKDKAKVNASCCYVVSCDCCCPVLALRALVMPSIAPLQYPFDIPLSSSHSSGHTFISETRKGLL